MFYFIKIKLFTFIWYFILSLQYMNFTHSATLRLYCGSVENFTSTELENPLPLLKSECFNASQNTMIHAFGYTSGPDANTSIIIIQSFLTIGNYNVMMIDWQKEASSISPALFNIVYPILAVPNSMKVGKTCGRSLNEMSDNSLDLNTTYLVGHSLGAHMMGFCGQELQRFNKNVSRITGLDPAGPMFEYPFSLGGLTASRAKFVDVLHTNPGFYGTTEHNGQVNIWFNCNKEYQPYCYNDASTEKNSCSHRAVTHYYALAVLNETLFIAEHSTSCQQWQAMNTTTNIINVGLATDRGVRGDYYLATSSAYPYGEGLNGLFSN